MRNKSKKTKVARKPTTRKNKQPHMTLDELCTMQKMHVNLVDCSVKRNLRCKIPRTNVHGWSCHHVTPNNGNSGLQVRTAHHSDSS